MKKTMKQSSSSKESSLLASATRDEIIVCRILLDLRILLSLSESLSRSNWGRRRRRSCLDAPPPLPPAPLWFSPSVQRTVNETEAGRPLVKAEEKAVEAAGTTASPDTPLSFSPSESDGKSKRSSRIRKTSKKRSREEYIDMIRELTQRRDLLRGKIENEKKYYNRLKNSNSELKAMKQEVLESCPIKEEPQMEMSTSTNLGLASTQHYRMNMLSHHPPSIEDLTVQTFQYRFGPITAQSSNDGLGSVNQMNPLGIDLNLPAEDAFEVDPSKPLNANVALADKRARFAEARRKRRGIIKIKAMRNACGIKLPTSR